MKQQAARLVLASMAAFLLTATARAENQCPATTAKGAVTKIEYKNGQVIANGTWEVGGSAAGALLEFRFDNDRRQAQLRTNTSGTWSIVESFHTCDRPLHALRIFVFPGVTTGDGELTACISQLKKSDPAFFEFPCGVQVSIDHCTWECEVGDVSHCAGMCAVTASEGRLPYTLSQTIGEGKEEKVGDSSQGSWNVQVVCKRGEKISFVAHDNFGRGKASPPAEGICGQDKEE